MTLDPVLQQLTSVHDVSVKSQYCNIVLFVGIVVPWVDPTDDPVVYVKSSVVYGSDIVLSKPDVGAGLLNNIKKLTDKCRIFKNKNMPSIDKF